VVHKNQTWYPNFIQIMTKYCYPEFKRAFEKKYYGIAKEFPEFNKSEIKVFVEAFRYGIFMHLGRYGELTF
jgi:hypothetical protein